MGPTPTRLNRCPARSRSVRPLSLCACFHRESRRLTRCEEGAHLHSMTVSHVMNLFGGPQRRKPDLSLGRFVLPLPDTGRTRYVSHAGACDAPTHPFEAHSAKLDDLDLCVHSRQAATRVRPLSVRLSELRNPAQLGDRIPHCTHTRCVCYEEGRHDQSRPIRSPPREDMTNRGLSVHLQGARRLAPIVTVSVVDIADAACGTSRS
jgi:hypothetical protein